MLLYDVLFSMTLDSDSINILNEMNDVICIFRLMIIIKKKVII